MCNLIFSIIKKHGFYLDYKSLYDLYAPIIGSDSMNLFISLSNEYDKLLQIGIKFTDASAMLESLGMNNETFIESKKMLEAMGLLKTYVDVNQKDYLYFELIAPLCFNDFIENQKYRHLLLSKIDQASYEKLEYVYNNNHLPQGLVNITASFEQVFNDENLNKLYKFNFERLYSDIIKNSHQTVILDNRTKDTIESFFSSYNLNISEIEHCVYESIIKDVEGNFTVDANLLQINLKKYTETANNIDIFEKAKINRNSQMFYERLDEEQLNNVFESYKNFNSEQYFAAIKKVSLVEEEIETINILRKTYKLDDCLINLMIDYSLLKTKVLNRKYLVKMAQTANNLNLLTLVNMYQHLTNNYLIKKTTKKTNSEITKQETGQTPINDVQSKDEGFAW